MDIKGSNIFAIGVCMIVSLYLHVFGHRRLYVAFPAGLEVGRMTKKLGSVGSLDGSSGSYL